jgi:hypothetical protein
MNSSEQAVHDTQQRHLREVWGKKLPPPCEPATRDDIDRDIERSCSHRLTSSPHRTVHEIPRRHTINGYAFDV